MHGERASTFNHSKESAVSASYHRPSLLPASDALYSLAAVACCKHLSDSMTSSMPCNQVRYSLRRPSKRLRRHTAQVTSDGSIGLVLWPNAEKRRFNGHAPIQFVNRDDLKAISAISAIGLDLEPYKSREYIRQA